MKTLYICGDSFSSCDPDYPGAWPELLQSHLPNVKIINLSSPAASNYLIYLQVKEAIQANCDYLIYNATSSVRQEFLLKKNFDVTDNTSRYWNLSAPNNNSSMICVSWVNPQNTATSILDKKTISELSNFFEKHIDLASTVEKNYIFIQHTLHLLEQNGINWAWSRGGFNHQSFSDTTTLPFDKWNSREIELNLWDYYDSKIIKPYYHITDKKLLQKVCDQYINLLNLKYV